jgi:hypothetical protein
MKTKKRSPRLTFMQKMAIKLMALGDVEVDNEEKWIVLRFGDKELEIDFDEKGENIESIGAFQDVVEVTGQKKIF